MNKKTRKLLTWCLVVAMVVTQMLFTNIAFASTRTAGNDRYMTAISISQANFTKADTVVLATGDDFADALAAAPLAYAKKGPLLLTASGSLSDGVLAEIQRLGAKNVIIVGGTKAVSESVASALSGAGLTVSRLSGADRYATSVAIANAEGTVSGVVVANGNTFADALSISSIAAFKGMAILLTDGNSLTSDQAAFVSGKTAYAVGGSAVVSDALVNAAKATRLAGDDRYSTNVAVASQFAGDLNFATVYVATGEDFADALAGAVAAANSKSVIILVGSSLTDAQTAFLKGKMTKDSKVDVLGGVNAVSDSVAAAVDAVTGAPAPAGGPVSVSSVKAVAADTIEVDFSSVPADTSKVVFTVQRDTTPYTVTPSWNGSVATLKYSTNFPQGDYTVGVKNNATDLGTNKVTFDQEKVAKIEITTDKFAVVTSGTIGYFTYKVENQYGEDVTNSNSASIQWTVPGVDPANVTEGQTDEKGVMVADSKGSLNFLNLSTISITGVDNTDNIVVTKTLSVSPSVGTISNFKLLDISNINNDKLQAGLSAGEVWNLSYEATDLAGNATDNFTLLQGGLIDQNTPSVSDEIKLSTSGYIEAKIVNQSGKGVIQLKVVGADNLSTDVPVTVTAITKNGTTSTLNLTLKRPQVPASFTIMAPTVDVAYGDAKEIPFVAYDADGNQLTRFQDIVDTTKAPIETIKYTVTKGNSVSLSPAYTAGGEGLYFVQRGDGTAKLMYQAPAGVAGASDITRTLTATTNSGKFSSVTINVRKTAVANTLAVSDSGIFTRLAPDGYIRIKHAWFTVKDQYGRTMSLDNDGSLYVEAQLVGSTSTSTSNLFAFVTGSTTDTHGAPQNPNGSVKNNGQTAVADQDNNIFLHALSTATSGGTQTIKFTAYKGVDTDNSNIVASKTIDFSVVKLDDITGIQMDSAVNTDTIYNTYNLVGTDPVVAAGGNAKYKNGYKVYGTDNSGNKIILPAGEAALMSVSVSDGNKYMTTSYAGNNTGSNKGDRSSADDYNKVYIAANSDNASFNTTVTVSAPILGTTTSVKTASFTIKASEDAAVAKSITAPDEINRNDYERGAVLSDAISVKDQYGKNMLERQDSSVQVYIDGVKQTIVSVPLLVPAVPKADVNMDGWNIYNTTKYQYGTVVANGSIDPANVLLSSLKGHTVTVVANNGQSQTVVIKNN